jgi:D-amino peptidase
MKKILFLFLLTALQAGAQKKGYKIYISGDMEGLAGAVTKHQLGPDGFEYGKFREIYTNEILAAINGARKAGATEFVVSDSHGNGQGILIDKLPKDVLVIRSWPRRFGMMAGIDETFDGAILLGYHTGTTNKEGVRAHTFSSAKLTDVKVNNQSFTEGAYSAMFAGHFNVPVIMVTGDDKVVEEKKGYL